MSKILTSLAIAGTALLFSLATPAVASQSHGVKAKTQAGTVVDMSARSHRRYRHHVRYRHWHYARPYYRPWVRPYYGPRYYYGGYPYYGAYYGYAAPYYRPYYRPYYYRPYRVGFGLPFFSVGFGW